MELAEQNASQLQSSEMVQAKKQSQIHRSDQTEGGTELKLTDSGQKSTENVER